MVVMTLENGIDLEITCTFIQNRLVVSLALLRILGTIFSLYKSRSTSDIMIWAL